jgi:hypothetical protein
MKNSQSTLGFLRIMCGLALGLLIMSPGLRASTTNSDDLAAPSSLVHPLVLQLPQGEDSGPLPSTLPNFLPSYRTSIGYRAGAQFASSPFFLNPSTQKVFSEYLSELRTFYRPMPRSFPEPLQAISVPLQTYIQNYRERIFPERSSLSGLSFKEAAEKITRAGFCFQLDPLVVVAKLQQETKFDRTASGTNGTGMSQLVERGIQEVFDQLGGNRGQNAPKGNPSSFNRAADCFLGEQNALEKRLWSKLPPNAINKKSLGEEDIQRIKNLILQDFDLDLLFGHVVLKVNLMVIAQSARNMRHIYRLGLVNYNGSRIKQYYGNSVMSIYDQISRLHFPIPQDPLSERARPRR